MAFDEDLDLKLRIITDKDAMIRKKMFGGTCYLLENKMVCGVWKEYLILRLGENQAKEALQKGFGKVFDITGKPMKGWIMVNTDLTIENIENWIIKAKTFVSTI